MAEPHALAEAIDWQLRESRDPERAAKERRYLKSELAHYGVSVPGTRAAVREALRTAELGHDEVISLAARLWAPPSHSTAEGDDPDGFAPVHERRSAAAMVLIRSQDRLGAADADFIERLLRESRTWALVDPLAGDLIGPITERDAGFDPVLERWAGDEDFWIRRSALLAHLRPLRQGRGNFARFARFADEMLEEKQFFIRKAIGWVLRDTARSRPDLVCEWLLPRAHRASGATIREAVKYMSAQQREAALAVR